jgi:hypothetical protein
VLATRVDAEASEAIKEHINALFEIRSLETVQLQREVLAGSAATPGFWATQPMER